MLVKRKTQTKGQLPNEPDVVDDVSAFDQISIPSTPDTDMDETNLTITFEGEHTNITNESTTNTNQNTMHTLHSP